MDICTQRDFMKSNFQASEGTASDQQKKLPQPPLEKPYPEGATLLSLPKPQSRVIKNKDIYGCLKKRRSVRKYAEAPLTQAELAFLLWATQGVQRVFGENYATYRPVPSAGARHPFETYLAVNRVEGLTSGVYRYLPIEHALLFLFSDPEQSAQLNSLTLGQQFVGEAAVVFIWSCLPYRSEWRYHTAAHKVMLIDAGHICQNLYLGCVALDCSACAIAAYDQEGFDQFLGLDGKEEFVVYLAPVGSKSQK